MTVLGSKSQAADLAQLLAEMTALVGGLGADYDEQHDRLKELGSRLSVKQFHLAVLGQFKRGKSTLINALIGEPLLPAAVVPLTAIPTFLRHGPKRTVRIVFSDGRDDLRFASERPAEICDFVAGFVTETSNPQNRLCVEHVEIACPSPLLECGVLLVDTPGVGSIIQHNTETTMSFLKSCDAALFVSSVDPPITETEASFMASMSENVADTIFALNKADTLDRREQAEALAYFTATIKEKGQPVNACERPIFLVSAKRALQAKTSGDDRGWTQSGVGALERFLLDYLLNKKDHVFSRAIAKKGMNILNELSLRLQLTLRSAQLPLDDLDRRQVMLKARLADAAREQSREMDLLEADHKKAISLVETRAQAMRKSAFAYMIDTAYRALEKADGPVKDKAVQDEIAKAITEFFDGEAPVVANAINGEVGEMLAEHSQRISEVTDAIRKIATGLFDIPYYPISSQAFSIDHRQLSWTSRKWTCSMALLPDDWYDALLPGKVRRARERRRIADQAASLADKNVETLRWALIQQIDDTFRRAVHEMTLSCRQTLSATSGAVQAVHDRRTTASEAITIETDRLAATVSKLTCAMEILRRIE